MPIKNRKIDNTEYISFKTEIELLSGIKGKQIITKVDKFDIETNYIVTKDGKVFNINTEKELKPNIFNGYKSISVQLGKKGFCKLFLVHRLLGFSYIPNPLNKPIINHKDGDKLNLDLSNLEWCTYSENNQHAFDTGLKQPTFRVGEDCNLSKYTEKEAIHVCELLQKGVAPKKISKDYNYGYDFVIKIKSRKTWKHISCKYTFPEVKKYSNIFTIEEINKMNMFFNKGFSVREVIDNMNWEYNEYIRSNVKHVKERFKHLKECGLPIYYEIKPQNNNKS